MCNDVQEVLNAALSSDYVMVGCDSIVDFDNPGEFYES